MWPSRDVTSLIYDWTNVALIASLAIGVVATVLVVWTAKRNDACLRKDLASANERTANVERETEGVRRDNLKLQADVERERAERLPLAAKVDPRRLLDPGRSQLVRALEGHKRSVRVVTASDMEAEIFARDFVTALKHAGCSVDVQSFAPGPPLSYGFAYFDPAGEIGTFAKAMVGIFGPAGLLPSEPFAGQSSKTLPTIVVYLKPVGSVVNIEPLKTERQ